MSSDVKNLEKVLDIQPSQKSVPKMDIQKIEKQELIFVFGESNSSLTSSSTATPVDVIKLPPSGQSSLLSLQGKQRFLDN